MTSPDVARSFLVSEVEELESFDLILVAPMGKPLEFVEVTRSECGALEVRVPARPAIVPALSADTRLRLMDLGFSSKGPAESGEPWICAAEDAESSVELLQRVHVDVFGRKPDVTVDIIHGTHRIEVESERRLDRTRSRIDEILTDMLGHSPLEDDDGDYSVLIGSIQVTIATRAMVGGEVVIRVFAITNVDLSVTPELGLVLARLNFGLTFGRFALDAEDRSIWFDETLLGEDFREGELRFVLNMVATTADGWDDRLKQMFGGATYRETIARRDRRSRPANKPGLGLGMYL